MKASNLIYALILTLVFFSCDKSSTGPESDDPTPTFSILFIIADSAGNNLLPYNLPDNPIVDPYSFHASSDWRSDIDTFIRHPEHGFLFTMTVEYYEFMDDPGFQQDSTFNMYPCFNGQCDTVTIYHPIDFGECDAKAVYWGSDTTFNYHCNRILVEYEY